MCIWVHDTYMLIQRGARLLRQWVVSRIVSSLSTFLVSACTYVGLRHVVDTEPFSCQWQNQDAAVFPQVWSLLYGISTQQGHEHLPQKSQGLLTHLTSTRHQVPNRIVKQRMPLQTWTLQSRQCSTCGTQQGYEGHMKIGDPL